MYGTRSSCKTSKYMRAPTTTQIAHMRTYRASYTQPIVQSKTPCQCMDVCEHATNNSYTTCKRPQTHTADIHATCDNRCETNKNQGQTFGDMFFFRCQYLSSGLCLFVWPAADPVLTENLECSQDDDLKFRVNMNPETIEASDEVVCTLKCE